MGNGQIRVKFLIIRQQFINNQNLDNFKLWVAMCMVKNTPEQFRAENFFGWFKHKKSSVFVGFTSPKPIKALTFFFVILIAFRWYLNVRIVGFWRSRILTKWTVPTVPTKTTIIYKIDKKRPYLHRSHRIFSTRVRVFPITAPEPPPPPRLVVIR